LAAKVDDHFSMNSEEYSVGASGGELVGTESSTLEEVEEVELLMGKDGTTPGAGEREVFWVDWKTGAEGFRE
jgi:hypothetical protein